MNKFYGSFVIFADDFLYQIYEKDGKEYSKIPKTYLRIIHIM